MLSLTIIVWSVTVALVLVALRQHDKRAFAVGTPTTGRRADTTRPVDAPSRSSRGKRARATTTTVPAPVVCTPATLTTTTSGRWAYRGKLVGAPVAAALMAPVHTISTPVAMATAQYLTTAHKGRHAATYTRHASGPVRELAAMLAY